MSSKTALLGSRFLEQPLWMTPTRHGIACYPQWISPPALLSTSCIYHTSQPLPPIHTKSTPFTTPNDYMWNSRHMNIIFNQCHCSNCRSSLYPHWHHWNGQLQHMWKRFTLPYNYQSRQHNNENYKDLLCNAYNSP